MKVDHPFVVAGVIALLLSAEAARAEAVDHPDTCAVLQSAATTMAAEVGRSELVFPRDIRRSQAASRFEADLTPYLQDFDLTDAERADLVRLSRQHRHGAFIPECAWRGMPLSIKEEGMTMTSEFSRPLFSSNGSIAVFGWSFFSPTVWAHGDVCLARRTASGWTAVCQSSWLR